MNKKIQELLKKKNQGIKLDLGCGENKQGPDWVGMDFRKVKGVDIVHNLTKFPFPLPNDCASIIVASHVLEHISKENWTMMNFFDELWRILKPGGEWMIAVPYGTSRGYTQDPTHVSQVNEILFTYFAPTDRATGGHLYRIYRPLPWHIKIMTWNETGNLECVLKKIPIEKDYNVNKESLKRLKKHSK